MADRLEPLLSFYTAPGFCNEYIEAFLARGLTPGPTAHEVYEQIELCPLQPEALHEAIRAGRVRDAKTIATFLYYEGYCKEAR